MKADEEIDYINLKNGIPTGLSKEEELLYNYTQDVTVELLMKISEELSTIPEESLELKL